MKTKLATLFTVVAVVAILVWYGKQLHTTFETEKEQPKEGRLSPDSDDGEEELAQRRGGPIVPPVITTPAGSAAVEQHDQGTAAGATLVRAFDGLGLGFEGPQGSANFRNPSDNSLAVGPNNIFQIVN